MCEEDGIEAFKNFVPTAEDDEVIGGGAPAAAPTPPPPPPAPKPVAAPAPSRAPAPVAAAPHSQEARDRVFATPFARKLAADRGIDLNVSLMFFGFFFFFIKN